jgi:thioredoxin-dependent peroxiredoxin
MKITSFALAAAFLSMFSFAKADPLKVGDQAPAVSGITETGATINLGTVYKQQPYTLVYFYPRAGTKGCTAQGCSLRDAYEQLTQKGVVVVGVSTDSVAAQAKFKDEEHFPFTLIADTDKTVINAFGVPTRAIPALGTIATRQAFLIKDGKIVWADYKAATTEQAADVLKVLATQGS